MYTVQPRAALDIEGASVRGADVWRSHSGPPVVDEKQSRHSRVTQLGARTSMANFLINSTHGRQHAFASICAIIDDARALHF